MRLERKRALSRIAAATLLLGCLHAVPATAVHAPGAPLVGVSTEHAKRLIEEEKPIFIDLRPIEEFNRGRIPGARSIPIRELRRRNGEVPRTGRVILYCACPLEEVQAAFQFLGDQGHRNISVMVDGFPDWVKKGYKVER